MKRAWLQPGASAAGEYGDGQADEQRAW